MPTDWTRIDPSNIPKSPVNVENVDTSVPPDTEVSGDPGDITMGPKKVFKTGYPTSKSVGATGGQICPPTQAVGVNMKPIPLAASYDTDVLDAHGVADSAQVREILYPKNQSVLDSIMHQTAYLVTHNAKTVDIAQHIWPINLEKANDVRTQLQSPIQYGNRIGVVAGCISDELILFKCGDDTVTVPIQDVDPIMMEAQ